MKSNGLCSICKYNKILGFGNNAQPINNGICCNWCNSEFVIPARIQQMQEESKYVGKNKKMDN